MCHNAPKKTLQTVPRIKSFLAEFLKQNKIKSDILLWQVGKSRSRSFFPTIIAHNSANSRTKRSSKRFLLYTISELCHRSQVICVDVLHVPLLQSPGQGSAMLVNTYQRTFLCLLAYSTTATACFFLSATRGTLPGLLWIRLFSSL